MTEPMPTESSGTRSSGTHSSSTDRVRVETRGEDTVVASVTVDAARSVVFTAFTDPAVLGQWFWPERFGTRVECDLRPGGSFAIRAAALPAGEQMGASGNYQEVEAPARLTMSWQWAGESAISQVAIELSDIAANRTEVVVTHSANPTTTDRDDHAQGWVDCLGRLLEAFERPLS